MVYAAKLQFVFKIGSRKRVLGIYAAINRNLNLFLRHGKPF